MKVIPMRLDMEAPASLWESLLLLILFLLLLTLFFSNSFHCHIDVGVRLTFHKFKA